VNFKLISVVAASLLSAAPAFSANVTVDFEDLSGYGTSIADHYSSLGLNFGADALSFSNDALGTYYSNAPSSAAVMGAVGADAAMNVASGFTGTVSLYYSAVADTTVSVYSGLNGTGANLGTFTLAANTQSCTDPVACHWDLASLNLSDVAKSIQFGSSWATDTGSVAYFDNVTVAPVPLPAAGWLLFSALGGFGAFARRKQA
jgi:hypothetical protein